MPSEVSRDSSGSPIEIHVNGVQEEGTLYEVTVTGTEGSEGTWSGKAIFYEELYYLIPNATPFPPSITKKGRTKITSAQGNTATIADPGFHFNLDLYDWAPQFADFLTKHTTKLQVRVYIDVFDDNNQIINLSGENHIVRTLNSSILFTMDGIGQKLDLVAPLRVLIPFVDTRWRQESHHDNVLNYILHVMVFDHKSFTYDFPLMVGTLQKSQKSSGPFVNGYIPEHMPAGMPWACYSQNGTMITLPNDQLIASPDGKEVRLPDGQVINTENEVVIKDIIYTEEGVWFNIHYQGNRPKPTYVLGGGASTNFSSPRSSDGQQTVDPFEACFLPYPRVKDLKPLDCEIKIGNAKGKYIFRPPSDHTEVYESLFMIKGSDLPVKPEKASETSPAGEVAEASVGLITQIINWFKKLFS